MPRAPFAQVPVFILAGGRGERLGGVADRPKPLLEVAGRPFLFYLLATLRTQGFQRVTLLTGHGAQAFEAWLREADPRAPGIPAGLDVRLMPEEAPLGTGGALRRILPQVDELALVLNGDSYCRADCRALLEMRRARSADLCLVATRLAEAADYGRLELTEEGLVAGFLEKGARGPAWVNAGIYAVTRRFLEEALPAGPSSLEREVLPAWIAREPSWALRAEGYFCDIGTPARLDDARRRFPAAEIVAALERDPAGG